MKKKLLPAFIFIGILITFLFSAVTVKAQLDSAVTDNPVRPPSPSWVDHAVFYEIYPQTFYDSNGDGVGDLKGIIMKLDYLRSVGVNALWLNPFYESPFRDAGYDVSDYYKVAKRYGTNDDAKELFAEAHKRGFHIIIDYVPGHTSIDHPWFQASASGVKNKYSNWYIWTNGTWDYYDKCKFNFIQGYGERDADYLPNFFWHQPALNYGFANPDPKQPWQLSVNNPDVMALKAEMQNVMKFWLDMGCDGFRVDMAGSLVKEDSTGECGKYWQTIRTMLNKEYPEAFMVSEWSDPKSAIPAGFNADFFHWFKGFDDLFTYFDPSGKGDLSHFMSIYIDQYNAVKDKGYVAITMANHDLPRLRQNGREPKDVEIILAFEMCMPGVPFIYYGDEIGMKQLYGLPAIEGSYGSRAGGRTPMQWDNSKNDGFSTAPAAQLYRAVDTSADAPNVAAEEKQANSLLQHVKKLVALRENEPALSSYAGFNEIYLEQQKYPFVFLRSMRKQRILVALNPSPEETKIDFTLKYKSKKPVSLAGDGVLSKKVNNYSLTLPGRSYGIYRVDAVN